jgi:hypothetical protein
MPQVNFGSDDGSDRAFLILSLDVIVSLDVLARQQGAHRARYQPSEISVRARQTLTSAPRIGNARNDATPTI